MAEFATEYEKGWGNDMEEKDVQRLLDMLYSMINEANRAAFSADRCVIDREEALGLLDEIRGYEPEENRLLLIPVI